MSDRPIIIVGVGRSGSTIFHQVMCGHPSVTWLSRFSDRYPNRPGRAHMLMQLIDLPAIGPFLSRHYDPGESYRFWDYYYRGFSVPCRDLVAGDVTPSAAKQLPLALASLATRKRTRPLLKITGWPRLGYLAEIFPKAKFVHVLRDGRAVANSFMQVDWWWGWRGPSNWRWGELSQQHQEEWERHSRSFVALAGIQWKVLMDAAERAKQSVPANQLLELRYEDVCGDPIGAYRKALEFSELPWTPGFERHLRKQSFRSENDKWRRDLTASQQKILETVLSSHLSRYGYA